jgi:triacylglycerol esterase/lipase EstA (alpha/beta hydrolase family)
LVVAHRLARAGLGPIFGFEYWTYGRVARASRQLGDFIRDARDATNSAEVDVIGHSMGGIVGRHYVTFGGGDGIVRNLVTLGTPHVGAAVSALANRELMVGSPLIRRLAAAPPPTSTKVLAVWSRADALVPAERQSIAGAETLIYEDLGHLQLLVSRRVTNVLAARLR